MMKVKVKIDLWIGLTMWGTNVLCLAMVFTIPPNEVIYYILFISPLVIAIIWIMLGSYYELREDLLFVRLGPFFSRIKYENIKSLSLKTNWLSSMAMSKDRIEIKEHHKGYLRGTTMISPVNREEFLETLKQYCYNLER